MWVFPLAAALTALAFAGLVIKEFVRRRRPYLLAWAIALFMFAAASAAAFLGILSGWNTRLFAIYWLFGAVLNVPFLAAGEVLLLFRAKAVEVGVLLVMVFITGFAFNAVRSADMRGVALECRDLPVGKAVFSYLPANIERDQGFISVSECEEALGEVQLAYRLAQYLSYPAYVILVAGAIWSAIRMRGRPELRNRFLGTLGIAGGATLVAIGSGVGAGLDVVPVFSIGLAAGIVLMFWGFLEAAQPTRPRRTHSAEEPA
jgi:hypothetical protein